MGNELNSTRLRFGPIAVVAAVLGLALGLAMPISPVAAGVQSNATAAARAKQALPSEAAKTEGVIVVAGKDKKTRTGTTIRIGTTRTGTTRRSLWSVPIANGTGVPITAP